MSGPVAAPGACPAHADVVDATAKIAAARRTGFIFPLLFAPLSTTFFFMASTFAEMNGASVAAEDCNTVAHMDPTYSESDRVVPGFAKEKTIVPRTKPDATNPAALSARNSPEKRYMTPLQLRSP